MRLFIVYSCIALAIPLGIGIWLFGWLWALATLAGAAIGTAIVLVPLLLRGLR